MHFFHLKIILKYSKNIKYEKDMANLLLNKLNNYLIIVQKLLNKEDFHFYYNIINKYLNCTFITNENKYMLNKFKNLFEKKKYIHKIKILFYNKIKNIIFYQNKFKFHFI